MVWQLRWTLLVIGVIFIAALAWWERRRPRQARGTPEHVAPREPIGEPARMVRDPPLTLPEIHAREPLGTRESFGPRDPLGARAMPVVDPLRAVPVLEPDPGAEEQAAAEETLAADAEEGITAATAADDQALGERQEVAAAWEAGPGLANKPALEVEPADEEAPADGQALAGEETAAPIAAESFGPAAAARRTAPTARSLPREAFPELPAAEPPLVEWPSDEERRILAVRLVAPMSERFAGRSLRQALAAEGFMLGEFAIFHKPDDERRAVLSAASLTRPGTFDMETMDSQHYGGLSLFAVLPGPRSPPQAFDDLVFTARNLNERLHGVLQDEHGTPLTPARIAQLREQLRAAS
jgi:FtsZ-interacting cell division protein ZipA